MKIFATRGRRLAATGPGVSEPEPPVRSGLPHRYEALGEALTSGSDVLGACAVAGEDLARDGASMQEALEGMRDTWRHCASGDPTYDAVSALVTDGVPRFVGRSRNTPEGIRRVRVARSNVMQDFSAPAH